MYVFIKFCIMKIMKFLILNDIYKLGIESNL